MTKPNPDDLEVRRVTPKSFSAIGLFHLFVIGFEVWLLIWGATHHSVGLVLTAPVMMYLNLLAALLSFDNARAMRAATGKTIHLLSFTTREKGEDWK